MKRYALTFLLVLAAFVAISCGKDKNQWEPTNKVNPDLTQPFHKDALIIGILGVPRKVQAFYPIFNQTDVEVEIQSLLFEPMVEYDDQGVPHPRLVESIPTLENGGLVKLPNNKIQTTWVLKGGLTWRDG